MSGRVEIGVEVDFYFVCFGRNGRRLEVKLMMNMGWMGGIRVAAAVVQQGRPVPISDSDKVGWAGVDTATKTNKDGKGSELKPQYLPSLHHDVFFLVQVGKIEGPRGR